MPHYLYVKAYVLCDNEVIIATPYQFPNPSEIITDRTFAHTLDTIQREYIIAHSNHRSTLGENKSGIYSQ